MVTLVLVGTKKDFQEALKRLLELDYAAAAVYGEAISSLRKESYIEKIYSFKLEHERHINELSELIKEMGAEVPARGNYKQFLTQGSVVFASLVGDKTILKALRSNEEDTNTAYERVNEHPLITNGAKDILQRGLEDEHRHLDWLEKTIKEM